MREWNVRQRAYGKINLALNVGETRPDGFHEVAMIMQHVSIWDEITLIRRDDTEITLECNLPFLGANEKNIAYRMALLMQKRYGLGGFHVRLFKKIPIAAGMAGGSADAAAVIKAVNRLFGLELSMDEMMRLGTELGSDIPFCLLGGTCLATGRGERLERIAPMRETHVALVKPNFGISTPWSYAQVDVYKAAHGETVKADIPAMVQAIERGALPQICAHMANQLEPAAIEAYPVIGEIKQDLMGLGAAGAMMTGSGPTVFGLFERYEAAREAVRRCKMRYPWKYQVMYCRIESFKKPY
ncbi:MAG: 4-(cytidine 5'-diphospho)-2-C-methyl-D-erythritol kinase [Lachnospiraceae bacterium]|nr:4-(cytidine 5'-diphospho)-2-C-methyl-D-erythritol kinase [Lachnospiraceae bacterium]